MGDKRFTDRIKRIEKRTKHGNSMELIAGVGAVKQAKAKAVAAHHPNVSPFLILFGGVAGVFTFGFLRDRVGLEVITSTSLEAVPTVIQDVVLVDTWITAATAFVALSALLTLYGFCRGRAAAKITSFFGASLGAVLGAGYVTLASQSPVIIG